jgi:hypothetical protein
VSGASGANLSRGTLAKASATSGERSETPFPQLGDQVDAQALRNSDETVSAVTRQTLASPYDSVGDPVRLRRAWTKVLPGSANSTENAPPPLTPSAASATW